MKNLKRIFLIALLYSFVTQMASAASLNDLMEHALLPIGKCLYVYGGGWNEPDNGAGIEAMTMGISDQWVSFYQNNDASYDYKTTRYQIHDGLDCTGYVGWAMYQVFQEQYSDKGYVYFAKDMAKAYAELFHGAWIPNYEVTDFQCGDVMSSHGHAYIVLGGCEDGSIVLLHASPPTVSLCGTYTPGGNNHSEAVRLAKQYMSTYFAECYERYPRCYRGTSYLTDYHQMRWNAEVLPDPDGYRTMTAEQILKDLFENIKVYVSGVRMAKTDTPISKRDVTFVPLRELAQHFNASVSWYEEEWKVGIEKDDRKVFLTVGSAIAEVDGTKKTLAAPVFMENDKTYVPVRFLAEAFGQTVTWDEETQTVQIGYE